MIFRKPVIYNFEIVKLWCILFMSFFCVLCYILIISQAFPMQDEYSNELSFDKLGYLEENRSLSLDADEIVWWNLNIKNYNVLPDCGEHLCRFSSNEGIIAEAKAVIVAAFDLDKGNMPLPREKNQIWALYYDESPLGNKFISSPVFLKHFNFSSTLSRYSDFPLLNTLMPSYKDFISIEFMESIEKKFNSTLPPVLFLYTDCHTLSKREYYVKELMKYIEVDATGTCLNNDKHNYKTLTRKPRRFRVNYYGHNQLRLIGSYKFVIAMENSYCYDYITEKFWRPLVAGSIPIYWGSPTIRDWQPNNKSVIYVDDFINAKALAQFLHKLSQNQTEYLSYLEHKFNKKTPIANERLKQAILMSTHKKGKRAFECWLCNKINKLKKGEVHQVTLDHYNCPVPPPIPPLMRNYGFDLEQSMCTGQCEAQVYNELFIKNQNISKEKFLNLVDERDKLNYCPKDPRCEKVE